jgi:hypothetical protein
MFNSIKYFLYFALCFFGIIWLFNFAKYNQLEDRYNKSLEEHYRLLKELEKDSLKLDSLETVYKKLKDEK